MDLGLRDRVALVTGASRGIGRGIAAALVNEGARVAIASRSQERIVATAEEIGGRLGRISSIARIPDGSLR
jgi:3-oxoacyl-[acyl-carrier protein] reductase